MSRGRKGFTILELLMVMLVIGVLAGMALLKYVDLRHRARAAQVSADLESIRLAAYGAWYEHNAWPGDAGPGVVPVDLVTYLPQGFSFVKPEYTLDWENFVPPGGGPSGGMQLGVVVTAASPRLQQTLEQQLGSRLPFVIAGNTLTFIIVGPDGQS